MFSVAQTASPGLRMVPPWKREPDAQDRAGSANGKRAVNAAGAPVTLRLGCPAAYMKVNLRSSFRLFTPQNAPAGDPPPRPAVIYCPRWCV